MRPKVKKISILILVGIFSTISLIGIATFKFTLLQETKIYDVSNQKLTLLEKIFIDDADPTSNWSVAKDLGICSGGGIQGNPYIIQSLIINGGGSENCIHIQNSEVYFMIMGCTLFNSTSIGSAGIKLNETKNGIITQNNCINNYIGIFLNSSCYNNRIYGNIVNHNNRGINVNNSNGNKIVGNLVNNNSEIGISLYGSDENTISKNAVNYNKNMGIFLSSCGSNAILENTISYNSNSGVDLFYSHRNTILRNSINYNSPGIRLRSSDYNDIKQNFIKRNFIGVEIGSGWRNDIITNCFTNNQILNALDETANNDWSIWMNGNFWDDYRGLDENNDGIGDTPYTISGSVVNTDEYPWMTCPLPLEDVDEITIEQLIPIYFFPGLLLYTVLILWFLYPERKLKK